MTYNIDKEESEWRDELTPEQFRVTRLKDTERAFTGQYHNVWTHGTYRCVCCEAELFRSEDKFDAGAGWPTFSSCSEPDNILTAEDDSEGMYRVEVLCQQCGAHLGHLFEDGPNPTGLRYQINSAALMLEED